MPEHSQQLITFRINLHKKILIFKSNNQPTWLKYKRFTIKTFLKIWFTNWLFLKKLVTNQMILENVEVSRYSNDQILSYWRLQTMTGNSPEKWLAGRYINLMITLK